MNCGTAFSVIEDEVNGADTRVELIVDSTCHAQIELRLKARLLHVQLGLVLSNADGNLVVSLTH